MCFSCLVLFCCITGSVCGLITHLYAKENMKTILFSTGGCVAPPTRWSQPQNLRRRDLMWTCPRQYLHTHFFLTTSQILCLLYTQYFWMYSMALTWSPASAAAAWSQSISEKSISSTEWRSKQQQGPSAALFWHAERIREQPAVHYIESH